MSQLPDQAYRRLFKASPGNILVLRPGNLEIVAVTDAYLRATMTQESQVLGKTLFEVFPDDPEDPQAEGVANLQASLERVQSLKTADILGILRYPVRRPDGSYEERFWTPVNTPVFDDAGEIEFIMHRVEDVTTIVQNSAEQTGRLSPRASDHFAVHDIILRSQELRQALSKLQEYEARMRTAERLLNLGAWEYNIQTGEILWSRQVYQIYDVPVAQQHLNIDDYFQLIHPEDRQSSREAYARFSEERATQIEFEHRVVIRDGSVRHIKGVGERHPMTDDEIVVGYVQDITPLISTRDQLSQAEHLLRLAGEKAKLGGWRVELDSEATVWTPETAAIHAMPPSYSPATVSEAIQFYTPEYRDIVRDAFDQCARAGEEFDLTCQLQTADGRRCWVRSIGVPERDRQGRVKAVRGAIQDISKLREAQERFHLISLATNDVICDWDLESNTVWWNDAMTDVFGYEISELEPGLESWSSRIHPDDRESVLRSIHKAAQGDETRWRSEYRFIKKDGQVANVLDRGVLLRDKSGKAKRMLGSIIDITARMEMEQKLKESQKLEAVGHLTGGVAHDFNNLLTVILGNVEMLTETLDDPKLRSMAEVTMSAALRGSELTNRLLAFARRQPLAPKPTDLNHLVEAMHPLIRRTLPKSIELEVMPTADLGITEIDAGELDTALLNLVVNARDAIQNVGKLTIETANVVIDQQYADSHGDITPGEYVMISVSDTGTGMPSETVEQAFDPFFTTKDVGKGSGLGLSMVFGFTKQSGGHIKIYSEPGEGTAVKLYFPMVHAAQQLDHETHAEPPLKGGTEHILIAEDDDLVLKHLESQLRSLGYRVTAVTSGPDALNALASLNDIDLLLTDIIMPGGMNGRELADRALGVQSSVKVLFTSGYTENAIVHHGRLDPGVDLLSKPYTRLELATQVRRVLDTCRHYPKGD